MYALPVHTLRVWSQMNRVRENSCGIGNATAFAYGASPSIPAEISLAVGRSARR